MKGIHSFLFNFLTQWSGALFLPFCYRLSFSGLKKSVARFYQLVPKSSIQQEFHSQNNIWENTDEHIQQCIIDLVQMQMKTVGMMSAENTFLID